MIIDIIVGIVLLVSAGIAFLRGFIREILTIFGVLGALVAAYFGGPIAVPFFRGWLGVNDAQDSVPRLFDIVPYTALAEGLAYGSIFIVVVTVLSFLSHFIAESAKSAGMGAIDRSLGVAFGLVRGVLLLSIIYLPVYLLMDDMAKQKWFSGSRTHFYLEYTSSVLAKLLPKSVQEKIQSDAVNIDSIKKTTKERLQNIDLLKKEEKNAQEENEIEKTKDALKEGYTNEFREEMNRLFEEQAEPGEEKTSP